jgi:hypothetical protein
VRLSADDGYGQGETEGAGARKRLRGSADSDPDRQRILHGAWVHGLAGERRPVLACPVDVGLRTQLKEQVQLLGEKLIIVIEVETEERIGLDE